MKYIKISIAAILTGVASGFAAYLFGSVLNLTMQLSSIIFPYNLILIPIIALITSYTIKNTNSLKQTMNQVFKASDDQNIVLSYLIIPFLMIYTWLSHLAGVSVGREGVSVQIGAVISKFIKKIINIENFDQRLFVISGMAAGFSGLFGTPLAAIFFAFEVTRRKFKDLDFWIITIIASYIASKTSDILGYEHFSQKYIPEQNEFSFKFLIVFLISVFLFIGFGILFVKILKLFKYLITTKLNNNYYIIFLLSLTLAFIMYLSKGYYSSLGINIIADSFTTNSQINILTPIIKLILTTFSVSLGFQGGEVTPLFSIGSSLGYAIGTITNTNQLLLASIGYATVFANATGAYYSGFFICLEIFGINTLPYIFIAIFISRIIPLKYSIYPLKK